MDWSDGNDKGSSKSGWGTRNNDNQIQPRLNNATSMEWNTLPKITRTTTNDNRSNSSKEESITNNKSNKDNINTKIATSLKEEGNITNTLKDEFAKMNVLSTSAT